MKAPVWLSRKIILTIHTELVARFGGATGLRDSGLLDSALARPQQTFSYSQPTLSEMAAAYSEGLVKNHPFVDGNKRIGFMAAYVFLAVNGQQLIASEEEAVLQTLALAAGEIGAPEHAAWLAANTVARR